jgi:hypothetical protein
MQMKGACKLSTRLGVGFSLAPKLLSSSLLSEAIGVAEGIADTLDTGIAFRIWWNFLLRVASEGVDLQKGSPSCLELLPSDRHSAIWCDGDAVHLRLKSRKHKPHGSYMVRKCMCNLKTAGTTFPDLCLLHSHLPAFLDKFTEGEHLFGHWPGEKAYVARTQLRRVLSLLGIPEANRYGLKAFRAGRATQMAADGYNLAGIMSAGEWASKAALTYINDDAVDKEIFTMAAANESDSDS